VSERIQSFYESYDEDGRLGRHSLEFARSKEVISRYLSPNKMSVADIGGASGVYSFWLASQGHDVHLLDFTLKHIEQAKARAENTGVQLAGYHHADARELPFADESFDLALVMGPLYHLQEKADRVKCLKESRRILKKGRFIICAVISRYASLIDGFSFSLVKDDRFKKILERDIETGCHDNPENIENYFTTAYLHTPDDISDELMESGYSDVKLIAVEGFANAIKPDELYNDPEIAPFLLEYIRKTESAPELLGVSGHILAIGRKI